MSLAAVLAVDAAAWCAVQAGAGYLVHRVPDRRLSVDGWLLRERAWEGGGRVYRRMRIGRWKRWLPEGGGVFGGYDKRALPTPTAANLERYRRETRRAELGHWLALLPAPLFALWNPPLLWPAMGAYAVAVNLPCIASQRYNRLRVSRVLAARENGSRASAAAASRSRRDTMGISIPYGSPP